MSFLLAVIKKNRKQTTEEEGAIQEATVSLTAARELNTNVAVAAVKWELDGVFPLRKKACFHFTLQLVLARV